MQLYEDQFSDKHNFPEYTGEIRPVIIASTARCGSHMLGHALHETQSFGFPLEYTNQANLDQWKKIYQTQDLNEVMKKIQQHRTSPNGVFGIKIHYSHIKQYGDFSNLQKVFPNAVFILLSRSDVLRQAVSYSIAKQTGVWIKGMQPKTTNPIYKYDDILTSLRQTITDNASWRFTLAANGCKYMELDFNDVRSNLSNTILKIANFSGVTIDQNQIPKEQVTTKQSNDLNEQWLNKFLGEFNNTTPLTPHHEAEHNSLMQKIKNKIKNILKH